MQTPLIFEHRNFSGNSFNFGNFRFLKKLSVIRSFIFFNIKYEYNITLKSHTIESL